LRTSFAAVEGDLLVLCDQPTTAALYEAKAKIRSIVNARRRSLLRQVQRQQQQQQASEGEQREV